MKTLVPISSAWKTWSFCPQTRELMIMLIATGPESELRICWKNIRSSNQRQKVFFYYQETSGKFNRLQKYTNADQNLLLFVCSFIQANSIAPLQARYCYYSAPRTARILCRGLNHFGGLLLRTCLGPYVAARVEFEPTTLRSKGFGSTNAPPHPTKLMFYNYVALETDDDYIHVDILLSRHMRLFCNLAEVVKRKVGREFSNSIQFRHLKQRCLLSKKFLHKILQYYHECDLEISSANETKSPEAARSR